MVKEITLAKMDKFDFGAEKRVFINLKDKLVYKISDDNINKFGLYSLNRDRKIKILEEFKNNFEKEKREYLDIKKDLKNYILITRFEFLYINEYNWKFPVQIQKFLDGNFFKYHYKEREVDVNIKKLDLNELKILVRKLLEYYEYKDGIIDLDGNNIIFSKKYGPKIIDWNIPNSEFLYRETIKEAKKRHLDYLKLVGKKIKI